MSVSSSNEEISRNYATKLTLAKKLAGGMIVVVRTPSEAYLAEAHGARAIIPVPLGHATAQKASEVKHGPSIIAIHNIMDYVTLPVVGRIRVGHVIEAKAMEGAYVNFLEENERLVAITKDPIPKHKLKLPFIANAVDLKEALHRIKEGASIVRTKYPTNEDSVEIGDTYTTVRKIFTEIKELCDGDETFRNKYATTNTVPIDLVRMVVRLKKLPVPFFAAGCIILPIDAAQMRLLGCDGVIVGSRIFACPNPERRLHDIAAAVVHYNNPEILATVIHNTGGLGKVAAI
ncbi:hypothetical protein H4R24_001249 [Coemansia sp. RSA 988]|nr:hypothetical protein H4R24_001249 [Coemansia sp. RSA 988]